MAYDASKLEQIKNEMQQKVINLAENFRQNPQEIAEYLKFSTRFYNYSNRNTMLIYQQNPGATFCNSYKAYQDMGYFVKRGEHGMKILVPTTKTYLKVDNELVPLSQATPEQKKLYKENKIETEKKLFFKVGTVFDIAQTNCPKEDYPKYFDIGYSSEQHAQIYDTLKNFCQESLDCPVNENAFSSVSLRGYYEPSTNSISLSGNFEDSTRLSILSHKAAHAMLHNDREMQQTKRPTAQIEFEADATSVMLQSYFGLEIAESGLRHLSDCYNEMISDKNISSKEVTESLERAHKAYKTVIDNINGELKPGMERTKSNKLNSEKNSNPKYQNSNQITASQNNSNEAQNISNTNAPNNSQAQTSATPQQPILPCQLPDMGMGGINFGM